VLEAADHVLHGGDVVAASVLDDLSALAPVDAVAGNMDDATLQATLPARRVVEIDGVRIGLVHDAGPRVGREERLSGAFPNCDAIVYGHTHVPQLERHGGLWIVNPGSPTERRGAPNHSMALLRVDAGALQPALVAL
jgi:putative phosphoesterase